MSRYTEPKEAAKTGRTLLIIAFAIILAAALLPLWVVLRGMSTSAIHWTIVIVLVLLAGFFAIGASGWFLMAKDMIAKQGARLQP